MCSTPFVEPPRAIITAMPFSKASRVAMSPARIPRRSSRKSALTESAQSFRLAPEIRFLRSTAAWEAEPGTLNPIASITDAIVLAVYIPPHEPAPGQA
jgi:hypothetical protein